MSGIIGLIIVFIIIWSGLGCIGLHKIECLYEDNGHDTNFFKYFSPIWLYRTHHKLNFLGVFLLTCVYNLISPLVSLFYWIVKFIIFICTVGRKLDEE